MEPWLAFPEMQDLGHLRFGVAASAGIGHRQRGRNAVRREKEIARGGPKLGVEVTGESSIAVHQRLGLAGLGCASETAGEPRQEAGQNHCTDSVRSAHNRMAAFHALFDGRCAGILRKSDENSLAQAG
jgi:hypothetical protein